MRGRSVLSAAVTALTLLALSAVATPPAHAVTCSRYGCDGLDPVTTGCAADATTIDSFEPNYTHRYSVRLRYSKLCYAAWTQVVTRDFTSSCSSELGPWAHLVIRYYRTGPVEYDTWRLYDCGTYYGQTVATTTMMSFDYHVQACTRYIGAYPEKPCTAVH